MYTGFRTTGNLNAYGGRNRYSVGLGKIRNTVGSINRPYNYCARTSADPLYCLFQFVPPTPTPPTPICNNYQQSSPWPFYRGINYDGISAFKGPLTNNVKWVLSLPHDPTGNSPVIDKNGNIYICFNKNFGNNGGLYSINSNCTINWTYEVSENTQYSNPTIGSDGTIYFTSEVGMYAINPDGSLKWNNTIGNGDDDSIVIDCNGIIYTGTKENGFFAINPSDGSIKWSILLKVSFDEIAFLNGWCFSINNNTIYCGSNDGLFSINFNGEINWWSELVKACIYSTPAFDKTGNIYIGSLVGLQYVNYKTGVIIQTISNGDCSGCSPIIDKNGNIFIGTTTGFYVYYPNRNLKYVYSGDFNFISPVIDNNENIYIYNNINYTFSCIKIETGFTLWSYIISFNPNNIYSTPAIDPNGVLYISYTADRSPQPTEFGIVAFGN